MQRKAGDGELLAQHPARSKVSHHLILTGRGHLLSSCFRESRPGNGAGDGYSAVFSLGFSSVSNTTASLSQRLLPTVN